MKKMFRSNEGIWKGAFALVVGLIMLLWPGLTTYTIAVTLGIGLIILGIILLISYFRRKKAGVSVRIPLAAVICLLFGLSMVLMPYLFVNILMIVFGILLVLGGIDQILTLFLAHRAGNGVPFFFYIAPIAVLFIGFFIMFSPAISARSFIFVFGITALVYGVVVLYNAYVLSRAAKAVKE